MQYLTERERECLAMVARHMRAKMAAREITSDMEPRANRLDDIANRHEAVIRSSTLSAFTKVGLIAVVAVVGAALVAESLAFPH